MSDPVTFIFLHGKGGSGKDTQADLLTERLPNSIRLSTGDIYRGAKSQSGEYAKFYQLVEPYIQHVDSGHFLPDDAILNMVDEVIKSKRDEGFKRFIFTGFPRTNEQLDGVDSWTNSLRKEGDNVDVVNLCFAVLDEHSKERSENRRQEHIQLNREVRTDDDPIAVTNKLQSYKEHTLPMLRRLVSENRIHLIRANGTKEDVSNKTMEILGHRNKNAEGNIRPWQERR